MASDAFIAFVEGKLAEHGIVKVIPPKDRLEEAFRLFMRGEQVRQAIDDMLKAHAAEDIAVPEDLEQRVREYLGENPEAPWSAAIHAALKETDHE